MNTGIILRGIEMMDKSIWKRSLLGLSLLLWGGCQSSPPGNSGPSGIATSSPSSVQPTTVPILKPSPIAAPPLKDLSNAELDSLKKSKLLDGYNHLAFELLHFFSKDMPKDRNLIFSPLAIASLLTLLYYQATGTERQILGKILQIDGMSNSQVQQEFGLLSRYLSAGLSQSKAKILTSLWLNQNGALSLPGQEIQALFNPEVFHRPFQPETEKQMNQWVQTHTQGQIKQIVAEKSLLPSQNLYLLNSLSFSSSWIFTFHKELTQSSDFLNALNRPVSFPFMNIIKDKEIKQNWFVDSRKTTFYGELLDVKALGLSFLDRRQLMLVLPQAKPTLSWAQILTYGEWGALKNSLRQYSIKDISVPRWKQNQTHSLLPLLQNWGLGQDKNNPLLKPDQALHSVNLETTEDGIDGTVLSGAQIGPLPNTLSFAVNRPFFYTLHDTEMNFILYMGIVNDPSLP